jgi:hypothetical protein
VPVPTEVVSTWGSPGSRVLGRQVLLQIATIVTPETILRWHRELELTVRKKWTYSVTAFMCARGGTRSTSERRRDSQPRLCCSSMTLL